MKRFWVLFVACVVGFVAANDCHAQFSRLTIGEYGIKSVSPESFRSVNGSVWIEVTNPDEGFTLSDISGMVYKNNVPFVKGTAQTVHIGKGKGKHVFSGHAALCDGVSLWTVLSVLAFDPEDYCVDISMRVTMDSGASRVVSKKKVPVKTLLKLK